MEINLSKPFASNGKVDEFDTRQIKKALNRLGDYTPYEKTGITGIPDAVVFAGLKKFQADQGLAPTGALKPGDETVQALSGAAERKSSGQYIWRTAGDDKVRPEHAALEGTLRDYADSPDPGEDYNCRCWAEPVRESMFQNNCDEQREKYDKLQKRIQELSQNFHRLLLNLQELIDEGKTLVSNAQKSLGGQAVAYIVTLPFEALGILSELLQRYFGNIISHEFLKAADNFMKDFSAVKQKAQHVKDQRDIVFAQLEQATKELEEAKKRLETCEQSKK